MSGDVPETTSAEPARTADTGSATTADAELTTAASAGHTLAEWHPPTARNRWTLGALGVLTAAFGFVAGEPGIVAGVVTAAVWLALGTPYGLAGGHVALVAVFPAGLDPTSFAIVELAFVTTVLAAERRRSAPLWFAAIATASALTLAGITWIVLVDGSLWLAAPSLLAVLAVATYGLYRYESVLGSVADDTNERSHGPAATEGGR